MSTQIRQRGGKYINSDKVGCTSATNGDWSIAINSKKVRGTSANRCRIAKVSAPIRYSTSYAECYSTVYVCIYFYEPISAQTECNSGISGDIQYMHNTYINSDKIGKE